jgi:hypothetical protein
MKRFLAGIALACCLALPVMAADEKCVPLVDVAEALNEGGISRKDVFAVTSVDVTRTYMEKLGLTQTVTANVVGFFFVKRGDTVLIGLVEDRGCVPFSAIISIEKHEEAFAAAATSL